MGVQRQLAVWGGVALGDESSGLAAWYKAEILETVDRQMSNGVVDHQMVDVIMHDAGLGKGFGAGAAERVRGERKVHYLRGSILIQRTIHYPFGDFRRRHEFELTVAGESLSTTGRALLHIAIRCVVLTW
jgi:hypothetical protein